MTAPLLGTPSATELHVMSLNIRRDLGALAWPRADRWEIRRPRLTALLRTERPDVLGVQEALPAQAAAVSAALGPSFRRVGHGRLPGPRGEGCPLFYDADRLELRTWRQVALSRTPDRPGSRSWLSVAPRVAVEASFRDRRTGAPVTVLNTHLDAFSPWARLRQAQAAHDLAAASATPVILLADVKPPRARHRGAPWKPTASSAIRGRPPCPAAPPPGARSPAIGRPAADAASTASSSPPRFPCAGPASMRGSMEGAGRRIISPCTP